jgi:hypothetical protein
MPAPVCAYVLDDDVVHHMNHSRYASMLVTVLGYIALEALIFVTKVITMLTIVATFTAMLSFTPYARIKSYFEILHLSGRMPAECTYLLAFEVS